MIGTGLLPWRSAYLTRRPAYLTQGMTHLRTRTRQYGANGRASRSSREAGGGSIRIDVNKLGDVSITLASRSGSVADKEKPDTTNRRERVMPERATQLRIRQIVRRRHLIALPARMRDETRRSHLDQIAGRIRHFINGRDVWART